MRLNLKTMLEANRKHSGSIFWKNCFIKEKNGANFYMLVASDGILVFVFVLGIAEYRLTRLKHDPNSPPTDSMESLL